jgi:hypothetical protein
MFPDNPDLHELAWLENALAELAAWLGEGLIAGVDEMAA